MVPEHLQGLERHRRGPDRTGLRSGRRRRQWLPVGAGVRLWRGAGHLPDQPGDFLPRQFHPSFPKDLEEAVILDGAGYWRVDRHITVPLSWPIPAALAVFFLANWNSFLWPLTITSDPNLRVVQVGSASFQQQYGGPQQ